MCVGGGGLVCLCGGEVGDWFVISLVRGRVAFMSESYTNIPVVLLTSD